MIKPPSPSLLLCSHLLALSLDDLALHARTRMRLWAKIRSSRRFRVEDSTMPGRIVTRFDVHPLIPREGGVAHCIRPVSRHGRGLLARATKSCWHRSRLRYFFASRTSCKTIHVLCQVIVTLCVLVGLYLVHTWVYAKLYQENALTCMTEDAGISVIIDRHSCAKHYIFSSHVRSWGITGTHCSRPMLGDGRMWAR